MIRCNTLEPWLAVGSKGDLPGDPPRVAAPVCILEEHQPSQCTSVALLFQPLYG